MAEAGDANECEQHTNESCNDAKHDDADSSRTQPSDDAELDEILEGILHRLKITPHYVYRYVFARHE